MDNKNQIIYNLITIGITSYNAAKTIDKAINSALNQTWINKEIIVIDDNSEDESWDIIKNYKKVKNIRIFKNSQNKGVAYSRNFLIKKAKGKFIIFFDDDDTSEVNRLYYQYLNLRIYKSFHKVDAPVFCYCKTIKKFENNGYIIFDPPGSNISKNIVKGKKVAEYLLTGNHKKKYLGTYATCSLMAEKKDFIFCDGFDESFKRIEDTEFALRGGLKGAHFIGVDKILVFQNMTFKKNKGFHEDLKYTLMMINKHKYLFKSMKKYKFSILWTKFKYEILQKNIYNSFFIFIKLCKLNLPYLMRNIFLSRITFRNNLFLLKNYKRNI